MALCTSWAQGEYDSANTRAFERARGESVMPECDARWASGLHAPPAHAWPPPLPVPSAPDSHSRLHGTGSKARASMPAASAPAFAITSAAAPALSPERPKQSWKAHRSYTGSDS